MRADKFFRRKVCQSCEIALGRPLEDSDPITKPEGFFSGHRFIVFVGYRKSERARGRAGATRGLGDDTQGRR